MSDAERIAREALTEMADRACRKGLDNCVLRRPSYYYCCSPCIARDVLARMDAAPDDDTWPEIPGGVWIRCTGCGETAKMPVVAPGRVSIAGLDGWTCPPLRCPTCSDPDAEDEADGNG